MVILVRMKSKYTLVNGDDWQGLYKDGQIVAQNHSLSAYEILELVGVEFKSEWVNLDWLENIGHLPHNLDEVKFED